jgi:hypothetical protein
MADHQNLHTGEKPHVCKICGFAAAAYTRLKVSTCLPIGRILVWFSSVFRNVLIRIRIHGSLPFLRLRCPHCFKILIVTTPRARDWTVETAVLRIRDFLVRIRIRGSVPQTMIFGSGSGSCSSRQ